MTRFALNRLGEDQIASIVQKLTGGKALPQAVMHLIARRTDGVPLFVEELTKTILESGVLQAQGERLVLDGPLDALAIPSTLHDSLMARLDRLQPIKEVAQTAACIGREFAHPLLTTISPLPEAELEAALDGLIKAELIYRRGLPPEATYLFKHALVRDAAYESLLKERRRGIHQRILAALEKDTGADIAPEVLAYHAEAAGLSNRAIDLWEAASKAAIARPAFDEAISHLGHAIALITPQLQNGDNPPFERALSLQVPLGMALLTRKGFGADETLAAFEHALALADKVGETPMRYSILYGLWVGTGIRGRHADALRIAEALVEQAARSPDTASVVVANRVTGASHWFMGDFAAADRYLDIALIHFDPVAHAGLANRFGQDVGVTVHIFMACNSLLLGKTKRALAHVEEAERLAKSAGHVNTICYVLMMRSAFSLMAGDHTDAKRCVTEWAPIAEEHNLELWLAYSSIITEILAAHKGDKTSIQRYQLADAAVVSLKCTFFISQMRIDVGWSALAMGLGDEAAELATLAQDIIDQTGETYALSELHRLRAAVANANGDSEAAEQHLNNALEVARQQGAKLWELRAAIDLAKLWHSMDRTDDAAALLKPVHDSIADGNCPEDRATAQTMLKEFTT